MLLLIAGGLAALVQYWLAPAVPPADDPRPVAGEPSPPPARQILPTPEVARPASSPLAAAPPRASSVPASVPAPAASPALRSVAPSTVDATPLRLPAEATAVPPTPAAKAESEVAEARATEGPPALALVDLNTASVADLNRLRGGGNIGRAIAAKRPYAAVGDLLSKRVLSRTTFERIREQVTVR